MKKIILGITTAIMMVVLCMTMTACSSIEGTYKFDSMTMDMGGVEVKIEAGKEYQGVTIKEDVIVLTINKDKTFTYKADFLNQKLDLEGTWELKDGKYYLTATNNGVEETLVVTLDGNKISFKETATEQGIEVEAVTVLKKQ